MEGYITVKEASEILNLAMVTVQGMIKRGTIDYSVRNGIYVVSEKSVAEIKKRQKAKRIVWANVAS